MPLINIEYDNTKIEDKDIVILSESIQKIVSEITEIKDVFVYANSAHIKFKVAPVEIFIKMSAVKIKDIDELFNEVKLNLSKWKIENNFKYPINLTLMPMNWKFETNI